MIPEEFDRTVVRALAELPGEFRARLTEVAIVTAAEPSASDRRLARVGRHTELFGLFHGVAPPDREDADPAALPPRVVLYQGPLERAFPPASLEHEIRKTVLHELGHYFGLSERRLRQLGYG